MPRLLLPFDGSEPSLRAVQFTADQAGQMRSPPEVILLTVVPQAGFGDRLLADSPRTLKEMLQPAVDAAAATMTRAAALLSGVGIAVQQYVEIGDPAAVIEEVGRNYHCEMIVMGTRGLGATAGMLLGSVANKAVHITELPVVLVK